MGKAARFFLDPGAASGSGPFGWPPGSITGLTPSDEVFFVVRVAGAFAPGPLPQIIYPLNRLRRRELVTTDTELRAMAAAARAGFRVQPQRG